MIARSTVRRLVIALTAAAALALPATAFADPAHPAPQPQPAHTQPVQVVRGDTYVETDSGNTQSVAFIDQPVDGDAGGPGGAMIVIRPTAARPGLVTPRTSFVQEMLKSVENI